jgi:SagB-type dehydrogenase family enzyme
MQLTDLAAPSDLAPLALLYHENSKVNPSTKGYLAESIVDFSSNLDELRRIATSAKTYPGAARVAIDSLQHLPVPCRPLDGVLRSRRSRRAFSPRALPLEKLAALLNHACGTTGTLRHEQHPEIEQPLRAYPSGGALYPIEVYLVAFHVTGLAAGVYHFHPPDRCLETARAGAAAERFAALVMTDPAPLAAPAMLVLAGRWERPLAKYGERGYRILWLDAGHVAQNLLLVAEGLNLAACPIAGFDDDRLAAELGLSPRGEPPLYVILIGEAK